MLKTSNLKLRDLKNEEEKIWNNQITLNSNAPVINRDNEIMVNPEFRSSSNYKDLLS